MRQPKKGDDSIRFEELDENIENISIKEMERRGIKGLHIVSKDGNYDFGTIDPNKGSIMLYNMSDENPDNNTTHEMRYDLDDVYSLGYDNVSKRLEIMLSTGDGEDGLSGRRISSWYHQGDIVTENYANPETIEVRMTNGEFYDTSNLNAVIGMIEHKFPTANKHIYYDTLAEAYVINREMFRGKGENKDMFTSRQQIEGVTLYGGVPSSEFGQIQRVLNEVTVSKVKDDRTCTKKFTPADKLISRAVEQIGKGNTKNPFLELIRSHGYDGQKGCVESFLKDVGCVGCDSKDDPEGKYLAAVSSAMFYGPIQLMKEADGDHMIGDKPVTMLPIIIGDTGSGKSTICKAMGLEHYKESLDQTGWYRLIKTSISDTAKLYEATHGGIINEIAEGEEVEDGDPRSLKAVLDACKVYLRLPYAEKSTVLHSCGILVATSNHEEILTDLTGARRMFPFRKYKDEDGKLSPQMKYLIDLDDHPEKMLDIWAEALYRYENEGMRWNTLLDDPETDRLAKKMQRSAMKSFDGQEVIADYLDRVHPKIGSIVLNSELKALLRGESAVWINDAIINFSPNDACKQYIDEINEVDIDVYDNNGKSSAQNIYDKRTGFSPKDADRIFKLFSLGSMTLYGFQRMQNPLHIPLSTKVGGKQVQQTERGFVRVKTSDFFL